MYYEEKIINNVLCRRSTPNGEWILFTVKELTSLLIKRMKLEGWGMKKKCILCNKFFISSKSYYVTCDECLNTLWKSEGKL